MAFEACLSAIQQAAGGALSDDDLDAILTDIVRRRRLREGLHPLEGDEAAFAAVAREMAEEEKIAAITEKRNRVKNILAQKKRATFYDANAGKEAFAISALNVGSERKGENFARSTYALKLGYEQKLVGGLIADLRRAGVLDALVTRDANFDRDVARELWRLNDGGGVPSEISSPEVTNKFARDAAEIIHRYQESARQMQNDAGAWIGKEAGYIVRQSHDMFRIRKAGFETWRDTIVPLLDERTFNDVKDRDDFLRKVYANLASGNHLKSEGAQDALGGFKGPGNLAKRLSQERELHFKDADAWFDYNAKFGSSSVLEAVFHGLERAARNTSLMDVWGTNPEAAFRADLDRLILKAKERGDIKAVDSLNGWRIKAEMDQLTGAGNIAVNPSLAQNAAGVRAFVSMAKLGGVVLSSLPDLATRAATLRHNGVGLLESYAGGLKSLFEGRTKGETREIADLLAAGVDGLMGRVLDRFSVNDSPAGQMSRLMNHFFRVNLLTWWTDAHTTGVGLMLARNLARSREKAFGELPELLRTNLTRYGIGEKEWNVLRRADTRAADGVQYLTPDMLASVADDQLDGLSRKDLENSLRSYYAEQVDEALTIPGAREMAITRMGSQPGTPLGEAVRFFMQFKTFPVTFVSRHLTREFRRGGAAGIAHLIVASTILGYLSQSAKQVAKGRTPLDPTSLATWTSAMQQGGGLGIYGDFLFGEYNRFGGGLAETVAGPAVGSVGDFARVLGALRGSAENAAVGKDAKIENAGSQFVRAVIGNTPFANLFYTRMALDYLVLYQLQESLNPGYLRRMERSVKKNGQDFIIRPSQAIPRGGGSRLFEGVR
jgi:hypothetical protein